MAEMGKWLFRSKNFAILAVFGQIEAAWPQGPKKNFEDFLLTKRHQKVKSPLKHLFNVLTSSERLIILKKLNL